MTTSALDVKTAWVKKPKVTRGLTHSAPVLG